MALGIGIDTGGTYTDAVVYDFEARKVLAKGKSPTTRQDLSVGIGRALDKLPAELVKEAAVVALSTTLATNACVEDKGGRAKLVMLGTTMETLKWVGAEKKYGLSYGDVLCLDTRGSFDGKVVEHPDWAKVIGENDEFLQSAEALGIVELNAMHNGAVCETAGKAALQEKYDVPFVMASELVSGLNIMERGATALLNARLLPVVDQFMKAVTKALKARGLDALQMIVRSDGSLMLDELARSRPVETILSGPAASVMGCRALAEHDDCLIVDMGGTTTDISIMRGGAPYMTGGIRIGGWRTQIRGVYIDTFGLGGDTRLYMDDGRLKLDNRRVEPICHAAMKWPGIRADLENLISRARLHTRPLHEFLYLVHRPGHPERYTEAELDLIRRLEDGPQMIGGENLNMYRLNSDRLEREGVVMRCGLTPTDIMHVRGDYDVFDRDAAVLAARYFLRALPYTRDDEKSMNALGEEVYELVRRRMFENIARVFIEAAYPEICKGGIDGQLQALIARKWERRNEPEDNSFFNLKLDAFAALVGMGAPTHLFLPDVAKALGVKCIIPEHSEVANAVGAVVADISAQAAVRIRFDYTEDDERNISIHAAGLQQSFSDYAEAVAAASEHAGRMAREEARRRGAIGNLTVTCSVIEDKTHARDGSEVMMGSQVVARATGRLGV